MYGNLDPSEKYQGIQSSYTLHPSPMIVCGTPSNVPSKYSELATIFQVVNCVPDLKHQSERIQMDVLRISLSVKNGCPSLQVQFGEGTESQKKPIAQ